ncbi:hypothetical protein [Rhodovastum atsumiense]|uniref:hypothetical protein n=1 Tax=Rhodovastum atsumiense TaxID=504468 RepID=UPI00139F29CD|nr:hypothetical protein [Rhodovastum atsumiense]
MVGTAAGAAGAAAMVGTAAGAAGPAAVVGAAAGAAGPAAVVGTAAGTLIAGIVVNIDFNFIHSAVLSNYYGDFAVCRQKILRKFIHQYQI